MVSGDDDAAHDFFKMAQAFVEDRDTQALHTFNKSECDGEWLLIGRFLSRIAADISWTKEEAQKHRPRSLL